MHALILMTVLAQWAPREAPHYGHVRESRRMGNRSLVGQGYAFFEFAPASGAGMPSACSTTAPTGAKGETLTFTRASNATCSKKGLATTGIADGDLVVLSGNIARVEPDSDGVLSFLREESRTNLALRSQELDAAPWGNVTEKCSVPTTTANYAAAPDGTTTAERIQIPSCTGAASVTVRRQTVSGTQRRICVFARSTSGAGAQSFYLSDGNSTGNAATSCNTVEASWSVCSVLSGSSGTINIDIGTNTYITAMAGGKPAADVLVWQVDAQDGTYCTSPIPTTNAAVLRQADSALSYTLATAIGTDFSLGATMSFIASVVTTATGLQLGTAAPNLASIGRNSNTAAAFTINATSTTPAVSAMGTTAQRGTLNDASGARSATWQGASVAAPAASMTGTSTAISFGALNARTSRVCADPVAGRCTP